MNRYSNRDPKLVDHDSFNTLPIEDYKYASTEHLGTIDIVRDVHWTAPRLTVTRLRCISDRGFPYWDVSYCHGIQDGDYVRVTLPFGQIPKPYAPEADREGFGRGFIINVAKRDGVYAKGLGILDGIAYSQG